MKQGAKRELMHDLYHTDDFFFYKADVIKRMRLVKIEFQKVYRQEDQDFTVAETRLKRALTRIQVKG